MQKGGDLELGMPAFPLSPPQEIHSLIKTLCMQLVNILKISIYMTRVILSDIYAYRILKARNF